MEHSACEEKTALGFYSSSKKKAVLRVCDDEKKAVMARFERISVTLGLGQNQKEPEETMG